MSCRSKSVKRKQAKAKLVKLRVATSNPARLKSANEYLSLTAPPHPSDFGSIGGHRGGVQRFYRLRHSRPRSAA